MWPLRLAVLIGFVFTSRMSCPLALRVSHPVNQDVNVEGTSQEANRCQDDWSHSTTHARVPLPSSNSLNSKNANDLDNRRHDSETPLKKS